MSTLALLACGDSGDARDAADDLGADVVLGDGDAADDADTIETPDVPGADADVGADDTADGADVGSDDSGSDAEDAASDAAPDLPDATLPDADDDDTTADATADAVPNDDTEAPDVDTGPDVSPPLTCAQLGSDACLSNPDCDAGEICGNFGPDGELRCCEAGTPGPDAVGVPCTTDTQCAFGRCIARDDGARFCSGACEGDLDCPGFMLCSQIFGWCYPKDTSWQPKTCGEAKLDQCFHNDNCDDADRCEDIGTAQTELLCCTPGPRGTAPLGAPCAAHTECAFGRCMEGKCSDHCDETDNPCPTAAMACSFAKGLCVPP